MASATLREIFAQQTTPPIHAAPLHLVEDYDWVYDDPDLAPFSASRRERKETPLEAFS